MVALIISICTKDKLKNKKPNNMFQKILTRIVIIAFAWIVLFLIANKAKADLTYKTYAGTGAYPSFPGNGGTLYYGTVLSTGTVSQLNYNWSGGYILDSGRSDRVIVNFYGYITIPDTGSQAIQFYLYADDGVYMKIDGTVVINDWNEQGGATWNYVSTDQTLTGGQTYYIDAWWYENGGGASFKLYWDQSGSVALVPSSAYSTTAPTPTSGITSSQQTIVNNAKAKTGEGIYIDQAGDNLDLDIIQDGDNNLIIGTDLSTNAQIIGDDNTINILQENGGNVLGLDLNGNNNLLNIDQNQNQTALINIVGDSNDVALNQMPYLSAGEHFADVNIQGDSNTLNLTQQGVGDKILFVETGSNNSVTVNQKDNGEHFLDIKLTNNHTVGVVQEGSGNHSGTIDLSGNTSSVDLHQQGSSNQNYILEQQCASTSCSTTVVQQ